MKRLKKLLCLGMVFCLALPLCISITGQAATTVTSESIKQKESQITAAQSEKQALQSSLTDVKKLKEQLETEKSDLSNYVKELDANLDSIQAKINELNEMITTKEAAIVQEEKELAEAQEVEAEQYAAMKARIKFMYERGDDLYLEMMLTSKSFGEMINKADYIEALSSYDRKMLDHYVEVTEYVQACKDALEAEKEVLDQAKLDVQSEEAALEDLIGEKEKQINVYSANINDKEAAIKEYEAQIADQNATIAALEAAVAEERRQLMASQGSAMTYDGGVFKWPAPSYTRISDDYGYRMHPILGVQQFHNGLDMAAPGGSPILAAYDGKVVAAAYSSSMGNYIMINHGDGLITIYMHASALYVSSGATVAKGQQIAAVGSTGRSTGNHLHFSVRLNGSYVSPWNYLK
ncbi:MAG: peptidoglycan DD-metalloendopeptidase family protein [Lachnospiraceae bacterium]|nr:peptidoglycan DD-metalloendopeptidase family protein [Lachnospiraceae bacterium]